MQRCKGDLELRRLYLSRKHYERDSAYLGLLDAFTQDGPQLILQIYIVAARGEYATKENTGVGENKLEWYVGCVNSLSAVRRQDSRNLGNTHNPDPVDIQRMSVAM